MKKTEEWPARTHEAIHLRIRKRLHLYGPGVLFKRWRIIIQGRLAVFHRGLQALVAVELKKTKFHPRDLGQLEFYLEALDRDVKRSNENPSIGIILCPDADKVVVEYAMSRSMSPTMVAEYKRILIPQEKCNNN